MKWKQRLPRQGDQCVVTFFAWLPVTIANGDDVETRWLQTVRVRKEYVHHYWFYVAFEDETATDVLRQLAESSR